MYRGLECNILQWRVYMEKHYQEFHPEETHPSDLILLQEKKLY